MIPADAAPPKLEQWPVAKAADGREKRPANRVPHVRSSGMHHLAAVDVDGLAGHVLREA